MSAAQADEALAWTVVKAWVKLDGKQVPVEVGIPVKVLEGLRGDVATGKRPWRASFTSGVAVRLRPPGVDRPPKS